MLLLNTVIFFNNSLWNRLISLSSTPSTEDSTYQGLQPLKAGSSGCPLNLHFGYIPQTLFSQNFCYDSSFPTVQRAIYLQRTCTSCPTMIFADFRFEHKKPAMLSKCSGNNKFWNVCHRAAIFFIWTQSWQSGLGRLVPKLSRSISK